MTRSLDIEVETTASGRFLLAAPWLDEPIASETFEAGYWEVMARHPRGR